MNLISSEIISQHQLRNILKIENGVSVIEVLDYTLLGKEVFYISIYKPFVQWDSLFIRVLFSLIYSDVDFFWPLIK